MKNGSRTAPGGALTVAIFALTALLVGPFPAASAGAADETASLRPCDIYAASGAPCSAAFSSTRALFAKYNGPLYRLKRASDRAQRDVGVLKRGGYANAAVQDSFCAKTTCVMSKIYDQTPNHNDLVPQGPTLAPYSNTLWSHDPVAASALPIKAGGHRVYGMKFVSHSPLGVPCYVALTCIGSRGQAYNNGNKVAKGVAVNGQPEHIYGVFGGTFSGDKCCFGFGNSEPSGTDNGDGTMNALNFSRLCWDECGVGKGPWVQADLENGVYMTGQTTKTPMSVTAFLGGPFLKGAGWCCGTTSKNVSMAYPFVTGMLSNDGKKRFSLKGAQSSKTALSTYYDGPLPPGGGYTPMKQEGAIILGSGGDQGTTDGEFFEGVMTFGIPSSAAQSAVQRNIASVGYTMP